MIRQRPFWLLAIFFLIGASAWLLMPGVTARDWLAALVLAVVLLLLRRYRWVHYSGGLFGIVVLLVALLLGFGWAGQAMWHQRQALEAEHRVILEKGREQSVQGRITGLPRWRADAVRVEFVTAGPSPRRYLLNWYSPDLLPQSGEQWQLQVKLKPPHGYANPGGFDYPRWLFRHGFVATGWVQSGKRLATPEPWNIPARVNQLRAGVRQWIQSSLPAGAPRALLLALSIGDRSELSPQDRAVFQATGTAHLIAISGLHVGLAAGLGALLGWLVFWLWPRQQWPRPIMQALFGWLFAFLYAALAGFSVATVRALVVVSVTAVAWVARRRLSPWDIWGVALVLVLLLDPMAVLDTGFWLSFTAVAMLIAAFFRPDRASRLLSEKQESPGRWRKAGAVLGGLAQAQLAIFLGLLPVMVLVFHQLHWLAPVVNFVLIPLVSVTLVPVLGLAMVVHAVTGGTAVDETLLRLAHELAQYVITALQVVSRWPGMTHAVAHPPVLWFGLWAVALVVWFFARKQRSRWVGLLGMTGLLGALLWQGQPAEYGGMGEDRLLADSSVVPDNTDNAPFRVSVMDVGQGLSVLVETRHHRLLYDTGAAFASGFNLADAVLLPFFRYRGVSSLDALVLSHRDNDHAGAAAGLLAQLPVATVYTTFPLTGLRPTQPCVRGLKWQWDGVNFEVLSPYNLYPYLGNNSSCVLRIGHRLGHVLLTGDVESPVEYRLTQAQLRGELALDSEVLLVPHHGSATSSSEDFIEAVGPELAINASGYLNAFGHPKAAVVARYRHRGIAWLDSRDSGLIELNFTPKGIQVSEYRRVRPARVWRLSPEAGLSSPGHTRSSARKTVQSR